MPLDPSTAAAPIDALALAQALIRCPSVTPADAGALDVLARALEPLGFACHRLTFEAEGTPPIDNLFATIGEGSPHFCFAGHTDVVPAGDKAAWTHDPFAAIVADGRLHGRGACDMKGAIGCFAAAAARFLADRGRPAGRLSLLITGDEEGPAVNGTVKVLEWLADQGLRLDACVVGEPTSVDNLGDMIKIGRRGSLTGHLTVSGVQGHTAYPDRADNPLPRLVRMLSAMVAKPLDNGSAHFPPSNLEITTIDVGNLAANVIPAKGQAVFNARYNDRHTGESLMAWVRACCDAHADGKPYDLAMKSSGDAFVTEPGALTDLVTAAIGEVTGRTPELSTTGGTSDARFIRAYCPVVELGLVGRTIHQVDEHVEAADIGVLTDVYTAILRHMFPA